MSSSTTVDGPPSPDRRPDPRWGSADVEGIVAAILKALPRFEYLEDCPHVPEDVNPADHLLPSPPFGATTSNDNALPGFGDPLPDCGQFTPEAIYGCPECGTIHEKRYICNRHDCPQHAPFAIRRLLLGNGDGLGVAAKFGGLLGLLNFERDQHQVPQSLFLSPPQGSEWVTESKRSLDRTFDLCGEILSLLGGEGIEARVTYHPTRGLEANSHEDDRGEWKKRLFQGREWIGDVAEELEFRPHFHVRGVGYADVKSKRVVDEETLEVIRVAEPGVDVFASGARQGEPIPGSLEDGEIVLSVSDIIEKRTGWVIVRSEDGDSRSMHHDDRFQQSIKIASALAYDMSHALVYTDSSGDRRLASRWKGKHVNEVSYNRKEEMWTKAVYEAAKDTLGIEPPLLECDQEVPVKLRNRARARELEPVDRVSELRREAGGPIATEPLSGWTGPDVDVKSRSSLADATIGGPGGWPSRDDVLEGSGAAKTAACGGELIHISQVDLELLVELEADGVDTSDLFTAYQSFQQYMVAKHLATVAGLYPDRPPPD